MFSVIGFSLIVLAPVILATKWNKRYAQIVQKSIDKKMKIDIIII